MCRSIVTLRHAEPVDEIAEATRRMLDDLVKPAGTGVRHGR